MVVPRYAQNDAFPADALLHRLHEQACGESIAVVELESQSS